MADKSTYIEDLKGEMRELETEIARARRHLDSGALRDKPHAAGELATLEGDHRQLEQRLAEAEKDDAEDWSDIHTGQREQLDAMGDALERSVGSYGRR